MNGDGQKKNYESNVSDNGDNVINIDNDYDDNSDKKGNKFTIKQRNKLKLIRYRNYKLIQDNYNHYREQIILFLPWRNEHDEVENINVEEKFHDNFSTIEKNKLKFNVLKDEVIEKAIQQVEIDNNDDEDEFKNINGGNEMNNNVDIFGQTKESDYSKINKIRITCPAALDKEKLLDLFYELNDKQRLITMHVINCIKTNKVPFKIFLSGSAGVGKSKVINCIYQMVTNYLNQMPVMNKETAKVMLCALSGKAAFLINGITLYTEFALPISKGNKPNITNLSSGIANSIREKMIDVKLLIIDEISMVGSTLLSYIDTRARQITGVDQNFGGMSVLVVGDLHQLPPVLDKPIYMTPNSSILSIFSNNILWDEFNFFELTEIMRQKDDKLFTQALNNLATGKLTQENKQLFLSRVVNKKNEVPKDVIRLYFENKLVDLYNTKKIKESNGTSFTSKANDYIIGKVNFD